MLLNFRKCLLCIILNISLIFCQISGSCFTKLIIFKSFQFGCIPELLYTSSDFCSNREVIILYKLLDLSLAKLQAFRQLYQKQNPTQVSSWEYCKIFQRILFLKKTSIGCFWTFTILPNFALFILLLCSPTVIE